MTTLHPEALLGHHRPHPWALAFASAAGAGVLARTVDHHYGLPKNIQAERNTTELYQSLKPDAKKVAVLLGGYCMSTREMAARFDSELASDVNLISPIHPDTGFHAPTIFENIYDTLARTATEDISLIGISMGGETAWDFLRYGLETGRRNDVEKISTFEFRGTPFGSKSLRFAPKVGLTAVNSVGYSYTLDHARRLVERWGTRTITSVPFPRVVEEGKYLHHLQHCATSLDVVPKRIIQVRGNLPDPFINEDRSQQEIEHRIGRPIDVVIDSEPEINLHAPTNERAARFMLAQLGIAR